MTERKNTKEWDVFQVGKAVAEDDDDDDTDDVDDDTDSDTGIEPDEGEASDW